MSASRPDRVGERAEQRITIVLREAAEGEKPLRVSAGKEYAAQCGPLPPLGPALLGGALVSAHSWGLRQNPTLSKSNSSESGPQRDKTSL